MRGSDENTDRYAMTMITPTSNNIVAQIRELGLKVGDTIESFKSESYEYYDIRLTLIWIGKDVAVWREKSRRTKHGKWVDGGEAANWTLNMRKWRKI